MIFLYIVVANHCKCVLSSNLHFNPTYTVGTFEAMLMLYRHLCGQNCAKKNTHSRSLASCLLPCWSSITKGVNILFTFSIILQFGC